jgi:hypothetical protein
MSRLADAERFEEAALVRDRLKVLVDALIQARAERWLVESGTLVVEEEGRRVLFRNGALVRRGDERGFPLPIPVDAADEVRVVARWIGGTNVRLVEAEHSPRESLEGGAALARLRRRLAVDRGVR